MAIVSSLYRKILSHGKERFMRTRVSRQCCTVVFATLIVALCMAPESRGQGGEPPYFAIRGAKIVPVSGRTAENSTIIISRGIISAIGADTKIPDEAWIIDGKDLTVYPGAGGADILVIEMNRVPHVPVLHVLYPAQIFGLADQRGTLENGRIANVIVTNGDPLDIRNLLPTAEPSPLYVNRLICLDAGAWDTATSPTHTNNDCRDARTRTRQDNVQSIKR
jgi:hypothetical protein